MINRSSRFLVFSIYRAKSGRMSSPRFDLYVKAGEDGKSFGDCPFSQRSYMFMLLTKCRDNISVKPVNIYEKPDWFLRINPGGKVPVLVDHGADDKIIDDSGKIVEYINALCPEVTYHCGYEGPTLEASRGIFPKLAALMKNQDTSKTPELKAALDQELGKLNAYLSSNDHKGKRFLLGDSMSELDCSVLPKLNHVRVVAKEYKGYEIPKEFTAVYEYVNNADQEDVWKKTCPADKEIVYGWGKHNPVKET